MLSDFSCDRDLFSCVLGALGFSVVVSVLSRGGGSWGEISV